MKRWCSIDFGTTNSCVGVYGPRGPEIVKIDGRDLVPSAVTIADGKAEVGHSAIRLRKRYPDTSYISFKRHMAEVFNEEEAKGSQMVEVGGMVHYQGPNGATYSPTELAGCIFEKLKHGVEAKLKTEVENVVACVPATFTKPQRDEVMEAARLAGFVNIEIMDEPTAAAVAYGYDFVKAHRIAVVDVGGGTTDISIIETGKGLVKVLATNGTPLVGGEDWDKHLRSYVLNLHELENEGSVLAARPAAMQLLLSEAEDAKKRLTETPDTEFRVEDIDKDRQTGADVHVIYPISREIMDESTAELLSGIRNAFERAIVEAKQKDPKFTIRDLDSVILVGGMTRVQAIHNLVADFFKQEPKTDVDPEIAVALGAAVRAGVLEGRKGDLTIKDITSHAYAVETHDKPEDVATEIVRKGTAYGAKFEWWLSNRDPEQEVMTLRLYQGDSPVPSENVLLWEHQITIPAGDPRSARIKLEVEVGASGEVMLDVEGASYGRAA